MFGRHARTLLPIEAIGNWLNTNANGQMHNERFLKLKIYEDVPNLSEMFERLKEVCHFYSFYLICIVRRKNFLQIDLLFCTGMYFGSLLSRISSVAGGGAKGANAPLNGSEYSFFRLSKVEFWSKI